MPIKGIAFLFILLTGFWQMPLRWDINIESDVPFFMGKNQLELYKYWRIDKMTVHFIAMWERDENNNWYNLDEIDSIQNDTDCFGCVYVIWSSLDSGKVLKVGQGLLIETLNEYKNNPEIIKYKKLGELKITWAVFPKELLNGIESFLSYKLNPLLNKRCPIDFLIPVNLPVKI